MHKEDLGGGGIKRLGWCLHDEKGTKRCLLSVERGRSSQSPKELASVIGKVSGTSGADTQQMEAGPSR